MLSGALPQRGQEPGDVGLGDLVDAITTQSTQILGIAPQVTAVGAQRVGRQATLDPEVVEVAADGARNYRRVTQPSTSSRVTSSRPCASATGP
jgi:hypothetical protein